MSSQLKGNEILYSVMPLFGEAAVLVIAGKSLRDVLERAFECKLTHVGDIQLDIEDDPAHADTVTFYGVMSALGKRDDDYSVLCSATVITYAADTARVASDLLSVHTLRPALKAGAEG